MKKLLYVSFLCAVINSVSAQDFILSFHSSDENRSIDSIFVKNTATGQTVWLFSDETLVLKNNATHTDLNLLYSETGLVYPNPFERNTFLIFNTRQSLNAKVSIINIAGRTVTQTRNYLPAGNHRFQLNLPDPGLYFIKIEGEKLNLILKALNTGKNVGTVSVRYLGSEEPADNVNNQNQLKRGETEDNTLDFTEGDILHFTVYSENNMTVVADSPAGSKTIEVEFFDCTDNDNRNYKITVLGDQVWMAENLGWFPSLTPVMVSSDDEPHYYVYDFNDTIKSNAKATENYKIFGALYNWAAAQNACPDGWHLPDNDEWEQLAQYIDDQKGPYTQTDVFWLHIGNHLKGVAGWDNDGNGTDDFGFSAMPGGYHAPNGSFSYKGMTGNFWSADEKSATSGWYRYMSNSTSWYSRYYNAKEYGQSVRCVRNRTE